MKRFIKNKKNIVVNINTSLFSDTVITKTLYWLTANYSIKINKNKENLSLEIKKNKGCFSNQEESYLNQRINNDLLDFKMREIIENETKHIREILFVKAFATIDDFDNINILDKLQI